MYSHFLNYYHHIYLGLAHEPYFRDFYDASPKLYGVFFKVNGGNYFSMSNERLESCKRWQGEEEEKTTRNI